MKGEGEGGGGIKLTSAPPEKAAFKKPSIIRIDLSE